MAINQQRLRYPRIPGGQVFPRMKMQTQTEIKLKTNCVCYFSIEIQHDESTVIDEYCN